MSPAQTIGSLNTERSYRNQGHATFEALCWLLCAMVGSRNRRILVLIKRSMRGILGGKNKKHGGQGGRFRNSSNKDQWN